MQETVNALSLETEKLRSEMMGLNRLADNFGQTITRSFASAIIQGRKLSDVLKGLALSFAGQALSSALKPLGGLVGSILPFANGGIVATPAIFGEPDVLLMDLAIATTASPTSPWIAAQAMPWPGRLALLKRSGTSSFDFNRFIEAQATMGTLLTPLAAGPLFVFDRATSFDVALNYGALSSVSEAEVLGGANIAAVGDELSGYEIIQFASAELIALNTYRVKTLLRGQGGSNVEMLASRAAPSNFVLLNGAVVQAELSLAEAPLENTWRVGPAQLDSGHSSYVELILQGQAKGLRPLSPCQLRAKRDGADVVFSWIRRTRVDGDGWELAEIPLGEETESYRLEILDGATVKRSVAVTSPSYRYFATDIATDFGIAPSSYELRIAQMSASFGRGATLTGTRSV